MMTLSHKDQRHDQCAIVAKVHAVNLDKIPEIRLADEYPAAQKTAGLRTRLFISEDGVRDTHYE